MICVAGMVAKREEKTGHKGNRRPRKRITVKEGEAEHASSDTPVEVQRLGNRQSSQVVGARGVGWRRTETRVRRCGGGRFAVHRGGRPALGASPFKLKAERTTRARPSGTRVGTPAINAAKRGKSAGAFGGCEPVPMAGPNRGCSGENPRHRVLQRGCPRVSAPPRSGMAGGGDFLGARLGELFPGPSGSDFERRTSAPISNARRGATRWPAALLEEPCMRACGPLSCTHLPLPRPPPSRPPCIKTGLTTRMSPRAVRIMHVSARTNLANERLGLKHKFIFVYDTITAPVAATPHNGWTVGEGGGGGGARACYPPKAQRTPKSTAVGTTLRTTNGARPSSQPSPPAVPPSAPSRLAIARVRSPTSG